MQREQQQTQQQAAGDRASQQQPQQQPDPERSAQSMEAALAATAAAAERATVQMKKEGEDIPDRHAARSSSSSSDRPGPGNRQVTRNIKELREEVEELTDTQAGMKRQLLFTMHRQVQQERSELAKQVVIQGFVPSQESSDMLTAWRERDLFCAELLSRLAKVPAEILKMQTSHSTSAESLSRLTIITVANAGLVHSIIKAAGHQKFGYKGAQVGVRRQTSVWDRLTSAPTKIAMDALSSTHPSMQGKFRVEWRTGELYNNNDLVLTWQVSIEEAKIRMRTQRRYMALLQDAMAPGLRRLNFGFDESDTGKGKSKGKGKRPKGRFEIPVDPRGFAREPEVFRNRLGNLQLARYPFTVTIKELKAEDDTMQTDHEGASASKRQSELPMAGESKRRTPTPTPDRRYHDTGAGQIPDPWSQARTSASASAPSGTQTSSPSTEQQQQPPLAFGARISA